MSVHRTELTTSAHGVSFGKRGLSRLVVQGPCHKGEEGTLQCVQPEEVAAFRWKADWCKYLLNFKLLTQVF